MKSEKKHVFTTNRPLRVKVLKMELLKASKCITTVVAACILSQILTLAIPVATKEKSIKLKAEVVWTSPKGFGMKFIKDQR